MYGNMKIDIYSHIMPQKYFAALREIDNTIRSDIRQSTPAVLDLEARFRLMDRYSSVLQVLTVSLPPLELLVSPQEAIELSRIANDEMAELVVNYPDKFVAAVACLPLNDIDASLREIDRAINQLGLKGIQMYSRVNEESLDNPKFRPIFEKMAKYDLPIWIHPCYPSRYVIEGGIFGLLFETASAMHKLVSSNVLHDYPDIKFVIHHCGSMAPLLEGRLTQIDQFKKFYIDTATYGSTPPLTCGYEFFGPEHMLFGTDAPMGAIFGHTLAVIKSVERMKIPDIDKEKIFLKNALDLLKISV